MAIAGESLTLEDIAERYKGTMRAEVVRTLAQMNSCLPHMKFVQSDLPEYFEYAYQRSLPQGDWIQPNRGTIPEVVGISKQTEYPGVLEMRSRTPEETIRRAGHDGAGLLYQEDMGFMMAMQQQGAATFYYGSKATNVLQFDGVSNILNSQSRVNVWSAGGDTADGLTSAYILDWDTAQACTMFYPPGSQHGIEIVPLPYQTVRDEDDGDREFEAYRSKFRLAWGFAIQNHRCAARYCNIDVEEGAGANGFNPHVLIEILNFLYSKKNIKMYVSRKLMSAIEINVLDKANAYYMQDSQGNAYGKPVESLRQQLPVFVDDAISDYEPLVPA